MLKTTHAQILQKPYHQIKDLKLQYPDQLDAIKANHKTAWNVFKQFNLCVYANLSPIFAKPHIENWCNGWQIRRHFFAYYKYQCYIQNAPILAIILNPKRLIVCLTWHEYKAALSKSSLAQYNQWMDAVHSKDLVGLYFWHSSVDEYGDFCDATNWDNHCFIQDNGFYRLGAYLDASALDTYTDDALIDWTVHILHRLSAVYAQCHGQK